MSLTLAMGLVGSSLGRAEAPKAAEELFTRTQYESSLQMLDKQSTDPATLFLLGRNYFMLGDFKKATEYLQKASDGDSRNADYVDWLGRAYGRRAETSNPLFAPGLASKARDAFEKAVQLDPKNSEALSDLFDYYLDAPGFLGGGYDKAMDVANKIAKIDPPEGYFEKAKLAQKRKEFDTAETHLKSAIAATPKKVSGLLEYAKFLAKQGRTKDSDAVLEQAERLQPNAPRVWYTRAELYIRENRNLSQARDLLQKYMNASLTVDDPPKQEAARLLRQVGGA
jgi:tetratricopeptide (TPR) repeat protein